MRYTETGINLEIDLSRGSIEKEETDPRLTELFLGGLVGIPAQDDVDSADFTERADAVGKRFALEVDSPDNLLQVV